MSPTRIVVAGTAQAEKSIKGTYLEKKDELLASEQKQVRGVPQKPLIRVLMVFSLCAKLETPESWGQII